MRWITKSTPVLWLALAAAAHLHAAAVAAQPGGQSGGEEIVFEVVSIDKQSWSVSAKDVKTGEPFTFKLPPAAFRGQRFTADVGGSGGKITVQGAPNARLTQATIEAALGQRGGRAGEDPGARRGYRRETPSAPKPGGLLGRSGSMEHPGGGAVAPQQYEVLSVDPRTWTVEAQAADGSKVSLEVDPEAFKGYRFQAAVKDLRSGQGFELLATNEQPLPDCCTLKGPGGR